MDKSVKAKMSGTVLITGSMTVTVLDSVKNAVQQSDKLSQAEQALITNWSTDTYGSAWTQLSDLFNLPVPDKLAHIWDVFLTIVRALL